jgi:hypothetical protein
MNIRTIIHIVLFSIILPSAGFAQETELDKRNGFKEIKLATSIDSVMGTKFKKDIKVKGHPVKVYSVDHPDYMSIGEIKVEEIEVRAYRGLVYEISVITVKDTRLMKGMESALGKPMYNVRDESYNWVGKNLGLKFRSHSKNQLELFYSSNVVHAMMREDKDKKIDDIADDF